MRRKVAGAGLGLVLSLGVLPAWAAPGDLDADFGKGGYQVTSVDPDRHESINDLAIQPDGKIVTAGWVCTGESCSSDTVLVRHHPDGSLDTSTDSDPATEFGEEGIVRTSFSDTGDSASSVVVQPDGKILVAGQLQVDGDNDSYVARYNTDGSLDTENDSTPATSFGEGGLVITRFGPKNEYLDKIALLPNGKILVVGEMEKADEDWAFTVARYHADGSLDTRQDQDPASHLSRDGKLVRSLGPGYDALYDLILRPKGKFVAGGWATTANLRERGVLIGFNADGSFDTKDDSSPKSHFSRDGYTIMNPPGETGGGIRDLARHPNGKLLAAYSRIGETDDLVARFSARGVLDSKKDSDPRSHFSKDGIAELVTPGGEYLSDVLVQPNGKTIAAGWTGDDLMVARLNSSGAPDATFGSGDGVAIVSISPGTDAGYATGLVDNASSLLLAGFASPDNDSDFMIAKFDL